MGRVAAGETERSACPKRLILIDDDLVFIRMMAGAAAASGVSLDCFASLLDVGFVGNLANYDGAIVDFDLGTMSGIEVSAYLAAFLRRMPMVLISGSERQLPQRSGGGARLFVHKREGCPAILAAALRTLHEGDGPTLENGGGSGPS
jgi:CheY-like chemotaxis protein